MILESLCRPIGDLQEKTMKKVSRILIALLLWSCGVCAGREKTVSLYCRTCDPVTNILSVHRMDIDVDKTAIVVIDMWDKHWCKTHTIRVSQLAKKMNPVLDSARALGIQICFAPSDIVDFYKDYPQRKAVLSLRQHTKPAEKQFDPPIPPWGKTGGCECGPERPCKTRSAWSRQNAILKIKANDLIINCNNNQELYNLCAERDIDTLIFMGTASNWCVSWTRSSAIRQMKQLGIDCILMRDMVLSISGNGYDPDKKKQISWFSPVYADDIVIGHLDKYFCPSALSYDLLKAASKLQPVFSADEVRRHIAKGPTQRFRHLCYDYNWQGRKVSDLPLKFTEADPVEYAEFSKRINLDAALVLAVPHHGYCTYETQVGKKMPGMKGDWFGRVVEELHKRNISAFGYITLGTNWKFMRDNYDKPFVRGGINNNGAAPDVRGLCLNAPGYLELIEEYTREVLSNYPVDALRYDMLFSWKGCLCDGCKKLYRDLYAQELTSWSDVDARRRDVFYMETLRRAVRRLRTVRDEIKPSVEMWQNHINLHWDCDIDMGRQMDIAYIEFGAAEHLQILNGILDKNGIIVGQTLKSPIRRSIMALGARCYQYVPVNQKTALPDNRDWFVNDLRPFFKMVSQVQPYLENAHTISNIGCVYSEASRYRFDGFDRKPYIKYCQDLTGEYLARSLPLSWINCLDLPDSDLSRFELLIVPGSSGLTSEQLQALRKYVQEGGTLLVGGQALLYDEEGLIRDDFSLAREMGLCYAGINRKGQVSINFDFKNQQIYPEDLVKVRYEALPDWRTVLPQELSLQSLVYAKPSGKNGTVIKFVCPDNKEYPLLHINKCGKGRMAYVASLESVDLIRNVVGRLMGDLPVTTFPSTKKVILTRQDKQNRWVLHILDDGDCTVEISKDFAHPAKVIDKYPDANWQYKLKENRDSVQIKISGNAKDRILVLR